MFLPPPPGGPRRPPPGRIPKPTCAPGPSGGCRRLASHRHFRRYSKCLKKVPRKRKNNSVIKKVPRKRKNNLVIKKNENVLRTEGRTEVPVCYVLTYVLCNVIIHVIHHVFNSNRRPVEFGV